MLVYVRPSNEALLRARVPGGTGPTWVSFLLSPLTEPPPPGYDLPLLDSTLMWEIIYFPATIIYSKE
jgi:hypothetical protein